MSKVDMIVLKIEEIESAVDGVAEVNTHLKELESDLKNLTITEYMILNRMGFVEKIERISEKITKMGTVK